MAKTYFIAAGRTAGALIERTLTHARALGRPPSATHRVEVLLEHPRLPVPAPFAPENAILLNLRGVWEALQAARSTGDDSHLLGWLNLAAGETALPSLESTEPHKLRPLLRLALFVEMQQASARLLQRLKMGLTEGVKAGEGVTAFIVGAWHDPETAAYLFDMAYLTRTTLQAEGYKPQIVALVILPAQADPALYPWLRTANRLGQVPPQLPNTSFAYLPFEALASDSDSFLSIPLLDALLCAQEGPDFSATALANSLALATEDAVATQLVGHLLQLNADHARAAIRRQEEGRAPTLYVHSLRSASAGLPLWDIQERWAGRFVAEALRQALGAGVASTNKRWQGWLAEGHVHPLQTLLSWTRNGQLNLPPSAGSWADAFAPSTSPLVSRQTRERLTRLSNPPTRLSDGLQDAGTPAAAADETRHKLRREFAPTFYDERDEENAIGLFTRHLGEAVAEWAGHFQADMLGLLNADLGRLGLAVCVDNLQALLGQFQAWQTQLETRRPSRASDSARHYRSIEDALRYTDVSGLMGKRRFSQSLTRFCEQVEALSDELQVYLFYEAMLNLLGAAQNISVGFLAVLQTWADYLHVLEKAATQVAPILASDPPACLLYQTELEADYYEGVKGACPALAWSASLSEEAQKGLQLQASLGEIRLTRQPERDLPALRQAVRACFTLADASFFGVLKHLAEAEGDLASTQNALRFAYNRPLRLQVDFAPEVGRQKRSALLITGEATSPSERRALESLREGLRQEGVLLQTLPAASPQWASLWVWEALLPLDGLSIYHEAQVLYERETPTPNTLGLALYDQEAQALHYEKVLNRREPLPLEISQFLALPHLLSLFARAHAFTVLGTQTLAGYGESIGLAAAGETFWLALSLHEDGLAWLEALHRFYLAETCATGEEAHGAPRRLPPLPALKKACEDALSAELARRKAVGQPLTEDARLLFRLQPLTPAQRVNEERLVLEASLWGEYAKDCRQWSSNFQRGGAELPRLLFACLEQVAKAQENRLKDRIGQRRSG